MFPNGSRRHAFAEGDFSDFLDSCTHSAIAIVNREDEDYVLKVDEQEYLKHIISQSQLELPEFHFDQKYLVPSEQMIPAEWFPQSFNVYSGKSYPKPVYTCHIPFECNPTWVYCRPSTYIMSATPIIEVSNKEICFDVIDFRSNAEEIKGEVESQVRMLEQSAVVLRKDVERYNQALPSALQQAFIQRKAKILKAREVATAIGIPIRRRTDTPAVFSVPPLPQRKVLLPKPVTPSGEYMPHPTLSDNNYYEILKFMHDFAVELERHPADQTDLDEEGLRNLFLTFLQPQFQGAATGETFNKSGKTDILVRYQNANIFAAECKIWKGVAKVPASIDQLLSYLTWRDSKTALVIFVRNKEITPALVGVAESIKSHPAYIESLATVTSDILQYKFELPSAPGVFVRLATLFVHLPK